MDGDDADFCNPALYEDERLAAMMAAFTNMLGVVRKNRRLDGALFEQYHRWAWKHDNGTDLPGTIATTHGSRMARTSVMAILA